MPLKQVSHLGWPINKKEGLTPSFGFPGGSEVKASASNAGDPGSIPGSGRSPGEGNGNPLQYSCLENPMDWGAWWAAVHRVTKSRTRLSDFTYYREGWQTVVCRPDLTHYLFCKHSFIGTHPTQFASVLVTSALMLKSKLRSYKRPNGSRS